MMDYDDDDDCILLDSQIITKTKFVREFQPLPTTTLAKKSPTSSTSNKENDRASSTSSNKKRIDHHNRDIIMDIDEDDDDCFLLDACLQTEADFVQDSSKTEPKLTSITKNTAKTEDVQNVLMDNDEDDDCILLDKSHDFAPMKVKDKANIVSVSTREAEQFEPKSSSSSLETLLKNLKPVSNEERDDQKCMIFYHKRKEKFQDLDETSIKKLKIEEDEKWMSVYERLYKKDLDQQLEKILYERYVQVPELTDSDKVVIQLEKREVIQEKKNAVIIAKNSETFSSISKVTSDEAMILSKLPDRIFEGILVNNQDKLKNPNILKPLISACESDIPKMTLLTRYGILPKMKTSKVEVRKMYSLIQQIVKTSEKIASEELFLPLFQEDIQIHKSFLDKVNLKNLIIDGLSWLEKEDKELTENRINILTVYFERNSYLDEQEASLCITLLEKSLRYKPNDQKVVQYFSFMVRKFIDSFTEEEIEKLKLLNNMHSTNYKGILEDVFLKKDEKTKRTNELVRALR